MSPTTNLNNHVYNPRNIPIYVSQPYIQSLSIFHKSLVNNIIPCTFLLDSGRAFIEHCVMTGTTSNTTSTNATNQQSQPRPGTISMPLKIYRPHLPSTYIEPDLAPDVLDGMELLYKDYGKSLSTITKDAKV